MGGQQGIAKPPLVASYGSARRIVMRQDGEDRFARGALDTPDRETAQADTGIMGMARQAPTTAVTGCLVCELEADSKVERRRRP